MAEMTLELIAAGMRGRILRGSPDLKFSDFGIDSRLMARGGLFFAVKGERDGHDFVADAAARGASGAVVSRPVEGLPPGFALVLVDDPGRALETLAATVLAVRRAGVRVIGITGSVGKTTTKDFTAAFIETRFRTLKSAGNFNNNLGLSLSLLRLEPDQQAVVLEMGMSAPGEILGLTRIAAPDVAVITNVNAVHLGSFDGLDGIALAKREILDGAAKDAVAVLNGEDPLVMMTTSGYMGRKILFGRGPDFEVRAEAIRRLADGTLEFVLGMGRDSARVHLEFLNETAIENVLAAAGAAMAMGIRLDKLVPVITGLRPSSRRGEVRRLAGGTVLYDDSYNSNPRALEAALASLAGVQTGRRRVAVLGDMLELGEKEGEFHRQAGRVLARSGWDVLVAVGPLASLIAEGAIENGLDRGSVHLFPDSVRAAERINKFIRPGDLVLVKGSHGMRTDIIADAVIRERKE